MATTPVEINFFDPAVNDCPYPAYQLLRDQAPVWKDPLTGMYVISRYDDIGSAPASATARTTRARRSGRTIPRRRSDRRRSPSRRSR